MIIQDRYYQDGAVNAIFDYYASGNQGNPVIAMPTGTGKGVVIAKFIKKVMLMWPRQRFMISTHVKELIEQNYNKQLEIWPVAPAGVYSAGLDQKDYIQPIIFAGVQSAVNNIPAFGWRDLLVIDECHLVSDEQNSQYQTLIAGLKAINPHLRVIGLSATPWRTGKGKISDGPIFTDIIYDITSMDAFNRLIDEGYIVPLIPKRTGIEIDVSQCAIRAGDYAKDQLEKCSDKDEINYSAVQEIIGRGQERDSWLIFATSIKHAEHLRELFIAFGIDCEIVSAKTKSKERRQILNDFKSLKLKCVVNVGVLTVGFDHPRLDLIATLRPTASVVLWVQKLGRGTRPVYSDGFDLDTVEGRLKAIEFGPKQNCLVLDFAGNTKRLGPINDPVLPKKRGEKKDGVAPIRICPQCDTYNHARALKCVECGFVFPLTSKITKNAGTEELIRKTADPIIEDYRVERVVYALHQKNEKATPILKVTYFCEKFQLIPEYVCLEHLGIAGKKARDWWRTRMGSKEAPPTVAEALKYLSSLKVPRQIKVWTNKIAPGAKKAYPEIVAAIF